VRLGALEVPARAGDRSGRMVGAGEHDACRVAGEQLGGEPVDEVPAAEFVGRLGGVDLTDPLADCETGASGLPSAGEGNLDRLGQLTVEEQLGGERDRGLRPGLLVARPGRDRPCAA
jgi:hypothetical protein